MIAAWARMCKILGKDFEQYLPLVMGPVLQAASLKPEVTLLDSKCNLTTLEESGLQGSPKLEKSVSHSY
ncbi:hypothetical protein DPMN_136703 [Dreissena polymorpha]|uniref:Uncharacterized protein n=1 Tax=Dreissena polymorpha TaxID=45954 RepID=A0A9D4G4A8_DREPO|nr:hypothetical protein DPMN_136703 [Dreissena polymorpha]